MKNTHNKTKESIIALLMSAGVLLAGASIAALVPVLNHLGIQLAIIAPIYIYIVGGVITFIGAALVGLSIQSFFPEKKGEILQPDQIAYDQDNNPIEVYYC